MILVFLSFFCFEALTKKKKYKEMRKNKKFTDKTLKRQKVFTNTMNCGKI